MNAIYVVNGEQIKKIKKYLLSDEFNKCIRVVHEIEQTQYVGDSKKNLKVVMSNFRMGI